MYPKAPNKVGTVVKTVGPASWGAFAHVLHTLQDGVVNTTKESGMNQEGPYMRQTEHISGVASYLTKFSPSVVMSRTCGMIPQGEWVKKGCSYCRCGYGILHCFHDVFHDNCGKTVCHYNGWWWSVDFWRSSQNPFHTFFTR